MATKLNTEHDVKRGDVFELDLSDVTLGVNSRVIPSPDEDDKVRERAISIWEHGQKTPVLAHRDEQGRVVVDDGSRRYRAVALIRQGFEYVDADGFPRDAKDPAFTLKVLVDTKVKSAEAAFVNSILGNQRDEVSDLQEAHAQRILRDSYGYSDAAIARLYGRTNTNRVAHLRKLLESPADVVEALASGRIKSVDAALAAAELPQKQRAELLDSDTPVTAAKARKKHEQAADAGEAEKPKAKPKNAAAWDTLVEESKDEVDSQTLARLRYVQKWLRGHIGDAALLKGVAK